jgi:hypothetical protein
MFDQNIFRKLQLGHYYKFAKKLIKLFVHINLFFDHDESLSFTSFTLHCMYFILQAEGCSDP